MEEAETFECQNWVEELCGAPEKILREKPEIFIRKNGEEKDFLPGRTFPRLQIVQQKNWKSRDKKKEGEKENCDKYDAGTLVVATLGELLSQAEKISKEGKPTEEKCTFVIVLPNNDTNSRKYTNIIYLQNEPSNSNAFFQVASNFNGVECISENSFPDSKDFLTNYVDDYTQGPFASVCAGAAAITRVIAPFYDEKKEPKEWAQTEKRQLKMLGDEAFQKYFKVLNGYGMIPEDSSELPEDTRALESLMNKFVVISHLDAEVTSGMYVGWDLSKVEKGKHINQILCAAMNIAQGASGFANSQRKNCQEKVEFLLEAAYKSAYAAAACKGSEKLFLTLVGGGAFGNPHKTIFEIICTVHDMLVTNQITNKLKEVYLPFYSRPSEAYLEEMKKFFKQRGLPYKVITYEEDKEVVLEEFSENKDAAK